MFLTAQHREALAGLTYAVLQHKGFVVLSGEAGTGKITLLCRVLQSLPASRIQFSLILNPTLTPSEFLELALLDFGIKDVPASKAQRLHKLRTLLLEGQREGKVSALIVDEAHKLSTEVLEEIRLLGNFEDADQKLLQIVLVGQDELDEILNRANLRQLKQRIAVRLSIGQLAAAEVGQYIRHRWLKAGGRQPPFSMEAVAGIAKASSCIPRLINALCDNALVHAITEGCAIVEDRHIHAAAVDLQLTMVPTQTVPGEPPKPEPEQIDVSAPTSPARNGASPEVSRLVRWVGKLGFRPGHEQS